MKVVINRCYGGFSLSKKAVKRMAELQGKECHFFKHDYSDNEYKPIDINDDSWSWSAFTVSNPNDYISKKKLGEMTLVERQADDKNWESISLECGPSDRSDPHLVQAVEELGEDANGDCAELRIVEIPDGVEYTIEEYDGMEHVAEVHRTWN